MFNIYPNFLLNVLLASVNVIVAIIISGIIFAITSLIPIPFKNIPRDSTMKNLTGSKYVIYCKPIGISSIGEINPDNKTAGIIKVIADRIACCCVLLIAEIYKPTPTIASNDIVIERRNKDTEPTKGILKKTIIIPVIIIVKAIAICRLSERLRKVPPEV